MNRREFLRISSSALAAGFISGCGSLPGSFRSGQTERRLPNIILFFSDDQGYNDLGCFGSKNVKTPNLDRLAGQGIRLTSFYVTSSVCTPSRSGLLTGRYPQRNGLFDLVRNNMTNFDHVFTELEYVVSPEDAQGLDEREILMSQSLREAGYATGVFGKWDFGRAKPFMPLQRGFDSFYGFSNTGVDYFTHERYGMPSLFRGNQRIKEQGYATDLFKREAIHFIEANKDRPFFCYVPFNSPHSGSNLSRPGVQAPDEYIKMYGEPPGNRKQRYWAAIICMDTAIGEILEKVKKLGLENNTVIIFTCDNGGGETKPLRGSKGSMYEGGIRVPFIARWPGKSKSKRTEHFWELRGARAARVGKWKWVLPSKYYVLPKDTTGQLYDLSEDIGEQNNLAQKRPDILKRMQSRWDAWMKEMAAAEPRGPFYKAYFDKLGYGDGNYRVQQVR
jgi:arylsulfatase A-like enzyme